MAADLRWIAEEMATCQRFLPEPDCCPACRHSFAPAALATRPRRIAPRNRSRHNLAQMLSTAFKYCHFNCHFIMTIAVLFLCLMSHFKAVYAADKQHHATATVDRRYELQILRRLLAAGYTYYARPLTTDNGTLEVRTRISLIKIQNLWERTDVKTEALEVTMRIQLNWCDGALSWEPDSFGGVDYVIIPGDRLWIPDIQIINALDDVYALIRDRRFDFKLHSDGCVWWFPTGTIFTRCELDLSYFPFDIQRCPIVFESAMYPKEFLNLTVRYDKSAVSLKTFTESGQWDLMTAYAVPKLNYVTSSTAFSRVEITLEIRRKTLYYKINVFFPCGMLSALQVLTFFLPIGSEDRISQSTTILLSVVVFQSIVVGELPRTSNSIPLLCLYIDFLTGISVVTVADAILGVYVLNKANRHGCIAKLFQCARFLRRPSAVTTAPKTEPKKPARKAPAAAQRRIIQNHTAGDGGDLELLPTSLHQHHRPNRPDRFVTGSGAPAVLSDDTFGDVEEDSLDAMSRHDIFSQGDITSTTNIEMMVLSSPDKSSTENHTITILSNAAAAPNYGSAIVTPSGVQVPLGKRDTSGSRRSKKHHHEQLQKTVSNKHKCHDPMYQKASFDPPAAHHHTAAPAGVTVIEDDQSSEINDEEGASSALRTAAVCIDNIVFLIALTSSIMIPFYMFNVLPPTS